MRDIVLSIYMYDSKTFKRGKMGFQQIQEGKNIRYNEKMHKSSIQQIIYMKQNQYILGRIKNIETHMTKLNCLTPIKSQPFKSN